MTLSAPSPELRGSRVFEYALVGTLPWAAFVALGFGVERLLEEVLPRLFHVSEGWIYCGLLASLYRVAWALIRIVRRHSPGFLATPSGYAAGNAVLPMVFWSIVAYVAIGVVFGVLAFLVVPKSDHDWPLIVVGFTLWVPLFFAGPAGSLIAWRRSKSEAYPRAR